MNYVQYPGPFNRLIVALEPWLDRIVIVGGWAHQLYRLHPRAQQLDYPPLATLDADIAMPATLPVGGQDIRERLLAHGFTEEFLGDDHPPATHYCLGGETSGFYAEFLTPLAGSDYDRKHKRKATIEIAGIASQQLRHIEILLSNPWSVDLKTAAVQIANPVSSWSRRSSFTAGVGARIARRTSCTCTTRSKSSERGSRNYSSCGAQTSRVNCIFGTRAQYRRRQRLSSETSATTFAGPPRFPRNAHSLPKLSKRPVVAVSPKCL